MFTLVFSQKQGLPQEVNLDSLWQVWNDNTQPDTSRCKAMYKISWNGYLFTQPDSAFYYAQQLYNFAHRNHLKKYKATALNTQGASFYVQSDYPKAIDYYTKSLKIRKEIGDKQGIAMSYNNIGIIYTEQCDYTKAIDYYTKSLKIREDIGDKKGIASSLGNIGVIYYDWTTYKISDKLTKPLF